jgi:flagellar protein FliO/FliZ
MMSKPSLPARAVVRAILLALAAGLLVFAPGAQAFTPATHKAGTGEDTPLNLGSTTSAGHTTTSGGGASVVRTIVGLLIVIAVIWGLTWVLKQFKGGRGARAGGTGLQSVATLPLGSNRSLHLVRAGEDYLLLGSAEQGVVPIHRYSEEQARAAGLLEDGGDSPVRPRAPGEAWPRGEIQMPGEGGKLLERLREWTVRK